MKNILCSSHYLSGVLTNTLAIGSCCAVSLIAFGADIQAPLNDTKTKPDCTQTMDKNGSTDVIYAIVGRFSVEGTFFGIGDQVFSNVGKRKTKPKWGLNGGKNDRSPFDTSIASGDDTYKTAFARIRYTSNKNSPEEISASLIQWYLPLDFMQTNGAEVKINVDHSAGIIDVDAPLANCGAGDPPCKNYAPQFAKTLTVLNSGKLKDHKNQKGRTLYWDACAPDPTGENSWDFIGARTVKGPGCVNYNAFGNVNSENDMVPENGRGDSYQTWNQQFQPFRFNGTDLSTATFTMSRMQIPNSTDASNTWLEITSSQIIKVIQSGSSTSQCP